MTDIQYFSQIQAEKTQPRAADWLIDERSCERIDLKTAKMNAAIVSFVW